MIRYGRSLLEKISDIPENYRPYLTFTVKIKSSNLWTSKLTQVQKDNFKEIKRLRLEGYTYKRISDHFNRVGRKTTRGKDFCPSGVHSHEKKMDKRECRLTRVFPIEVKDMDLVFEKM